MVTSPKMKSFSSAEKEDDERECAQTFLNVSHAPSSTRPDAVRSMPISLKVYGCVAAPALIEPAALLGLSLSAALRRGGGPSRVPPWR